jgi:hypothetical protein
MSKNTQYLRGKQRERGSDTQRFMTDGFDRWAETSAPASFNSMEKIPTELVNDDMASGIRYSQKLDGMVGSARSRKGKRGGAWWDDAWNSVANEFTNPESYLAQGVGKLGNEFTDKDSLLRGQYLGQAADGVSKAAPIIDILAEQMGLGKGVGKTMADVLKGAQEVNKAASSVGLGKKRGGRVYTSPYGRPYDRPVKGGRVYTSPYGRPYDRPVKGGQKGALDYVSEMVPQSREGIKAAKTYAPLLKALLKGEAPQYSAQIDQGAKMLGLGKKKGKKGGFLDFGAIGRDIENAFRPVGEAFNLAPQLIAQPIQQKQPFMGEIGKVAMGQMSPAYLLDQQGKVAMGKVGGRKPSARNEVVKRVMAERGCSLPEASSIVKREGLY